VEERGDEVTTATVTVETVREALNTIVDPCSVTAGAPAGLVDMGLVRSIQLHAGHANVTIGVTEPMCLMGAIFLRDVRSILASLDGIDSFDVRFDHNLRWDESMMAPSYRIALQTKRAQT
jgi:metal-sulfur cluster biosynthetic enzyme